MHSFINMEPTIRERRVGICHVPKGPAYGH
jgi:hypothetical protein